MNQQVQLKIKGTEKSMRQTSKMRAVQIPSKESGKTATLSPGGRSPGLKGKGKKAPAR